MLVIIHKHDWGMRRRGDDTIRGLFMNETKNRRAVPVDGFFNSANYYTLNSCFIGLNCESMSLNFFYAAAINDVIVCYLLIPWSTLWITQGFRSFMTTCRVNCDKPPSWLYLHSVELHHRYHFFIGKVVDWKCRKYSSFKFENISIYTAAQQKVFEYRLCNFNFLITVTLDGRISKSNIAIKENTCKMRAI